MKLFGSTRSPYVLKVRIALHERGVPHDYAEVRASDEQVVKANPLAKIPTLIRDDGRGLYDSSVIVEYADGLGAAPKLIPSDFESRIEVRRWEALGDGIMDAVVEISHANRLPDDQRKGPEFYAKHEGKINSALAAMNAELGHREFCFGTTITLADVACIAALLYLDLVLPDSKWRERNPNLARHLETVRTRPSLKTLLQDR